MPSLSSTSSERVDNVKDQESHKDESGPSSYTCGQVNNHIVRFSRRRNSKPIKPKMGSSQDALLNVENISANTESTPSMLPAQSGSKGTPFSVQGMSRKRMSRKKYKNKSPIELEINEDVNCVPAPKLRKKSDTEVSSRFFLDPKTLAGKAQIVFKNRLWKTVFFDKKATVYDLLQCLKENMDLPPGKYHIWYPSPWRKLTKSDRYRTLAALKLFPYACLQIRTVEQDKGFVPETLSRISFVYIN